MPIPPASLSPSPPATNPGADRLIADIQAEASQRLKSLSQDGFDQTFGWAEHTLQHWPAGTAVAPEAEARARSTVLTLRAHALREQGGADRLLEAILAYDDALAAAEDAALCRDATWLNETASLWMKRGISLLTLGDPKSLQQALPCFDKAIELRAQLPLEVHPWYRWGLSAGWMNRGDVLTRMGGESNLQEAVRSYDLGIAQLHVLPLDARPEFRWRLALGWMNRGITWQALGGDAPFFEEALHSFDTSIAVMRGHEDRPRLDYQRVVTAAWANRANLLVSTTPPLLHEAAQAARNAVERARFTEADDVLVAESGLKARHALCRALANLLETPPVDLAVADEWIEEATDAVEESLQLSRLWESRGEDRFRPLLEQVFHFGTRIYRAFQPHFLAEFLLEGLAPAEPNVSVTEPMQKAAHEALGHAAMQIKSEGLSHCTPARLDRLLDTLADLRGASEKLAELRASR